MSANRRTFLKSAALLAGGTQFGLLRPLRLWAQTRVPAASDRVRFALIGAGVRGCQHLQYSLTIPGVECVAVSDLYDGRQQAAREYLNKDVFTTRDYRAVLDRKDVDAVLVAATDHQHARLVADSCAAGKDVYCEKPLSHTVEEGFTMVEAARRNNRVLQAGAQRVSSVLFAKAREIFQSGALGEVYMVEAFTDRNSPSGAWEYPIPPDASETTIDWKAFLAGAPSRPFDPVRFFRWRCFRDYGEGLGGDLFVHLISGIMFVMGVNQPPLRAQSTGGIFRWKDREYPDLMETLYDYPGFRVSVRCNQNNNAGESTVFYGTKGTLNVGYTGLAFTPQQVAEAPETYSTIGWPARLRAEYLAQWNRDHPKPAPLAQRLTESSSTYTVPAGYVDTIDHQANFFASVRSRTPPVEDGIFGNHAAISCHMANQSYFTNTAAVWDATRKRIAG